MDSYINRVLHTRVNKHREPTTAADSELKKMRRRVYDAVNKCKDLEALEDVMNRLKRGGANGSARDS